MKRIALEIDEDLFARCEKRARNNGKTLPQWILETLAMAEEAAYETARARAKDRLKRGLHLGGKPLSREELHER